MLDCPDTLILSMEQLFHWELLPCFLTGDTSIPNKCSVSKYTNIHFIFTQLFGYKNCGIMVWLYIINIPLILMKTVANNGYTV